MRTKLIAILAASVAASGGAALAAEGNVKEYLHPHWSTDGVFGHFEQSQLQRGYQVYREVCSACHSMNLVAFRHLGEENAPYHLERCPRGLGIPESTDCSQPSQNPIVKSLAAAFQITAGPDDAGDMFQRPGLPTDYLPSPYENRQQAMAANGGAYPPDMSLLVKTRHHGANYIYSLLQGYEEPPETIEVPAGQHYNVFYPGDTLSLLKDQYLDEDGHPIEGVEIPYGGAFKMAKPLQDGIVTYEDGSPETVAQYSKDVVAFLTWAAEPKLEQRKAQGRFVVFYLLIFAAVVYGSYRQLWKKAH